MFLIAGSFRLGDNRLTLVSLGNAWHPALARLHLGRLVRFRSGEALVALNTEMVPIFQQVVATGDRYGLHAYVTAVENANLLEKLESDLRASTSMTPDEKERFLSVLMSGSLASEEIAAPPEMPKAAALK